MRENEHKYVNIEIDKPLDNLIEHTSIEMVCLLLLEGKLAWQSKQVWRGTDTYDIDMLQYDPKHITEQYN